MNPFFSKIKLNKMKNKYFTWMIFLIFIIGLGSCEKESTKQKETETNSFKSGESEGGSYIDSVFITNDGVIYSYYFDGKKRKMSEFHPTIGEGDQYIVVAPVKSQSGGIIGVNVFNYSNLQGYLAHGVKTGHDFNEIIEFQTNVQNYAIESGALSQYERTGTVPTAFENWFYQQTLVTFGIPDPIDGAFTVYKHISGGPAWMFPLGQALFMPPGWNNEVSKFYSLHIFGSTIFYDKTFYRNRMATFTDWGWKYWYFTGPLSFLNDKTSSCMDVGL